MIQPPTDSLYKFMAITGILLAVFIIVYPRAKVYELDREATSLQARWTF
jgi:cell division protein FtsL